MFFAFLLTVWHEDKTPPAIYVADYHLTAEDCIDRMQEFAKTAKPNSIQTPSCEFESAELLDVANMQK